MPGEADMSLSGGQIGFGLGYGAALLLLGYSEVVKRARHEKMEGSPIPKDVEMAKPEEAVSKAASSTLTQSSSQSNHQETELQGTDPPPPEPEPKFLTADNPLFNLVLLKDDQLIASNGTLWSIAEFGLHMIFYYVCDRTSAFPEPRAKAYSRDVFWFIYLLLVVYAVGTSIKKGATANYLNRDQTEEWKGWMQVLFLMYHYFNAKEQYNSIRMYIAAYVWMTGFGNFSFYYIRKDFSPTRFFQMLWRLNFLVFWACVALNNDYMLYYICPMHTIWTIAVYLALLIGKDYNTNNTVVMAKIAASIVIVAFLWESKDLFYAMWAPLTPVVGYVDPSRPQVHEMHEWYFRSGLDRYIWIFGMVCANFHPNTEKFLLWMDQQPSLPRFVLRGGVLAVLGAAGYYWYANVFVLDKREYNKLHPFTSWIPILIFIILRNLTPTLREYSVHVFAWLGKITLETYIGQFHIWLHTDVSNGQPKTLLSLLPTEDRYPLLNFLLCTPVYIFVSYRLFHLTNALKADILPSGNAKILYRNLLLVPAAWVPFYVIGRLIKSQMS